MDRETKIYFLYAVIFGSVGLLFPAVIPISEYYLKDIYTWYIYTIPLGILCIIGMYGMLKLSEIFAKQEILWNELIESERRRD